MNKATYYQRCVITMAFFSWPSIQAAGYLMHRIPRNKEKLRAYQREYARQKRAPGHRKVSRAEHALLEEKHVQRHNLLTAAEDLLHQCFDGLLDPPWTSWGQLGPAGASWCQLVQHPKVSKLPCPQAMSKSSTISSQSDDQQVGKFHKLGKSIW